MVVYFVQLETVLVFSTMKINACFIILKLKTLFDEKVLNKA